MPREDREEVYREIADHCSEPDASFARNNLAILLIRAENYKKAAEIAERIQVPEPGSPADRQITMVDRIRLHQTRARAFDYADRQDRAIGAYYDALREGADAVATKTELVSCASRFLRKEGSSQALFPLAAELEIRTTAGLGQQLFRELWDQSSASPDRRGQLERLILRLYAAYPPRTSPFRDARDLRELLEKQNYTKSLLHDIALAFCGSRKCGDQPFDWKPFSNLSEVSSAFPAATALRTPEDWQFGIGLRKSLPNALDDGVAREAFAELVSQLAAARSAERPNEALALSTAGWLLDPGATQSAVLTASLIESSTALESDGAVRKALLAYYAPEKLRIDTLDEGSSRDRERLQVKDLRNILRIYKELGGDEAAQKLLLWKIAAHHLAHGAEDSAEEAAEELAALNTDTAPLPAYQEQRTVVGVIPPAHRGANITIGSPMGPCELSETGTVYTCTPGQPLERRQRVEVAIKSPSGRVRFRQRARRSGPQVARRRRPLCRRLG
jgi:hypothetical protein